MTITAQQYITSINHIKNYILKRADKRYVHNKVTMDILNEVDSIYTHLSDPIKYQAFIRSVAAVYRFSNNVGLQQSNVYLNAGNEVINLLDCIYENYKIHPKKKFSKTEPQKIKCDYLDMLYFDYIFKNLFNNITEENNQELVKNFIALLLNWDDSMCMYIHYIINPKIFNNSELNIVGEKFVADIKLYINQLSDAEKTDVFSKIFNTYTVSSVLSDILYVMGKDKEKFKQDLDKLFYDIVKITDLFNEQLNEKHIKTIQESISKAFQMQIYFENDYSDLFEITNSTVEKHIINHSLASNTTNKHKLKI